MSFDEHVKTWKKWKKTTYNKNYRLLNYEFLKEKNRIWGKQNYLKNKTIIDKKHREYRLKNLQKIKQQQKDWYLSNPEKRREYILNNKIKIKNYLQANKEKINAVSRIRYQRNTERILRVRKSWRIKNPSKHKIYRVNKKLKAFKKIQAQISCVRCGCDDLRFLEINHKNGGGCKEAKTGLVGTALINAITSGKRSTDDLELLFRPCNHIHYLELKYGEKIPLKVKWNPQPELDIRNFAWVRVR